MSFHGLVCKYVIDGDYHLKEQDALTNQDVYGSLSRLTITIQDMEYSYQALEKNKLSFYGETC